jgi:hypothetical protein
MGELIVDDEQREVLREAGVAERARAMERADRTGADPLAAYEAPELPAASLYHRRAV